MFSATKMSLVSAGTGRVVVTGRNLVWPPRSGVERVWVWPRLGLLGAENDALKFAKSPLPASPPRQALSVTWRRPASISEAAALTSGNSPRRPPVCGPPARKLFPPPIRWLSSMLGKTEVPYCATVDSEVRQDQSLGHATEVRSVTPGLSSAPGFRMRLLPRVTGGGGTASPAAYVAGARAPARSTRTAKGRARAIRAHRTPGQPRARTRARTVRGPGTRPGPRSF